VTKFHFIGKWRTDFLTTIGFALHSFKGSAPEVTNMIIGVHLVAIPCPARGTAGHEFPQRSPMGLQEHFTSLAFNAGELHTTDS
jgi:hypothetical protein